MTLHISNVISLSAWKKLHRFSVSDMYRQSYSKDWRCKMISDYRVSPCVWMVIFAYVSVVSNCNCKQLLCQCYILSYSHRKWNICLMNGGTQFQSLFHLWQLPNEVHCFCTFDLLLFVKKKFSLCIQEIVCSVTQTRFWGFSLAILRVLGLCETPFSPTLPEFFYLLSVLEKESEW